MRGKNARKGTHDHQNNHGYKMLKRAYYAHDFEKWIVERFTINVPR